ncbi:MAG: SpoIIE family protein phosphatase, partial [Rhodospirillales bacterium]|nr:SpoIIE family protein phosphatase [Rhodospirillales bacterium]
GVTEAFNEVREQYGIERLMERFTRNTTQSVKAVATAIFNDVDDHTGDAEQSDDITVLCLKMG